MKHFKFNQNKINIMINCAALGDTICSLPILYALHAEGRINKILSNPKWRELLSLTELPADMITFMFNDKLTPFDPGAYHIAPLYQSHRAPYCMHLVDFFSQAVAYAILTPEQNSVQIPRERLPENALKGRRYIVLQSTTRLRSRTLLPATWLEIKKYIHSLGYEIVLLGDKESSYDTRGCITDYMACSISTSISVLWDAACCVGVDGGLLYLAALTDCPIVAGYTFVNPRFRLPYRHGEFGWKCHSVGPYKGCHYCTDSLCAFGIEFDVACPAKRDFECVTNLRSLDFINGIEIFAG